MYWIAINGASCALCPIASEKPPASFPRPQYYAGFDSLAEAQQAQDYCLNAPIEKVRYRFGKWCKQGRVVRVNNPEPVVDGQVQDELGYTYGKTGQCDFVAELE